MEKNNKKSWRGLPPSLKTFNINILKEGDESPSNKNLTKDLKHVLIKNHLKHDNKLSPSLKDQIISIL